MNIYYSDLFVLPLPAEHRFPMEKYEKLRDRVVRSPVCRDARLLLPPPAGDLELGLVHEREYLGRVVEGRLTRTELRTLGFPWSPELVARSRQSVGGTISAGNSALADGVSANLAGGTHHAFPDRGEGFCVFNDVAVAIHVLRARGAMRRAAVIDLDVHQGNGTAAIFQGDPDTFTLSVHGDRNFPFEKVPGDLDLALPDGASDGPFLEAVRYGVAAVLERMHPDLVFYLAGADAFRDDRLGRLDVSRAALGERDDIVIGELSSRDIPVALVMGGGYAPHIDDTVEIHLRSVETAARAHQQRQRRETTDVELRTNRREETGGSGAGVESSNLRRMGGGERSRRADRPLPRVPPG